jgi:hypothetical protein
MSFEPKIDSWRKFAKQVRSKNKKRIMLNLINFPDSVLVGGCQRSGTTMLSRAIMMSSDIAPLSGVDTELTAALILAGRVNIPNNYRYCFQTTYINDHYNEYWSPELENKLVWVIRNPLSVVYSLTRFSERFCLDGLFESCGQFNMTDQDTKKLATFGSWPISRIRKACYCYNAKAIQIESILNKIGSDRVMIVDYDKLVKDKEIILSRVFDFLNISYNDNCSNFIHSKSLNKADGFSCKEQRLVTSICGDHYSHLKTLTFTS